MRVALIHDHLAQDGGAEKVLKALADMFPKAPIYTLLYEKKNADKYFKDRHIETSVIQNLPGGVKHYQWYMPFMPMAVEFFDLRNYDLVISDASAFAKGVITSPDTLHICYCHTPTRYIWDYTHQYISELRYNKYLKKIISLVLNYIRIWDRQAADRVDKYIANSKTVQKRIKKYYRRNSVVIYPPVDTNKCYISDSAGNSSYAPSDAKVLEGKKASADKYFLIGGRLAPYKRIDMVIEAFKKLDYNLKVFGDGVDLNRLRQIAGDAKNIQFLGRVDEKTKFELYSKCLAFLNPQEEDFGITVVEAMASGRPIIAFKKGGATETVV
ncbi:MAG: glycosyltransferase, partial [Patescibacteria group bacterium]